MCSGQTPSLWGCILPEAKLRGGCLLGRSYAEKGRAFVKGEKISGGEEEEKGSG